MVSCQARSKPRATGTRVAVPFVCWPASSGTIVANPKRRRVATVASSRCVGSSSSNPSLYWLLHGTVERRPHTRSCHRISRPIGKFLLTIPQAVAPFIQEVLEGDDHQWKYWCIVRLIGEMTPAVAEQYRIELFRLAVCPTLAEAQNELNEVAKDALQKLWPCEYQFRSMPLLNNYEEKE